MAQLAIKGHATRGKEIIEIFLMLGGEDAGYDCVVPKYYYYIDNYGNIYGTAELLNIKCFKVYTLEEFIEKFPYKVGDKVQHKGATSCGSVFEVEKMRWEEDTVKYELHLWGCNYKSSTLPAEYLQPYKEETMEEKDTIYHTTEINLNHPCFNGHNEIELIIPNGWKFEQRGNKMFGVRKQYPKTYAECAKLLNCFSAIHLYGYKGELLEKLQKLIICRDAYWKIVGEQMGLDIPWKPDWNDDYQDKWIINFYRDEINLTDAQNVHFVLAFPTEEMRDAFFDNFKNLIEQCKELL